MLDLNSAKPASRCSVTCVHIVIMGCGRVGSLLARSLEDRGHSTAVVDNNPDAFRRLGPEFSGQTVTGVGFDRHVLAEAGIEHADAFAAVSSGDNSNIIAARVARERFSVENVVARIYDPRRAEVYERLGIPTVATVPWAADQVLRRLLPDGSEPVWRDATGDVQLEQFYAPRVWIGRPVREFEEAAQVRVSHLKRLGIAQIARPETVFQDNDYLSVFLMAKDYEAVRNILDKGPEESA